MFNNMLVTSLTPLGQIDENAHWENRPFISKWPHNQPQQPYTIQQRPLKKTRSRYRTSFTTEQLIILEKAFEKNEYICPIQRKQLAVELKLGDKCVKVWFQNRRMKKKKENLERNADTSSDISTRSPSNEQYDQSKTYIPNNVSPSYYIPPVSSGLANDLTAVSSPIPYHEATGPLPNTAEPVSYQPYYQYPYYFPPATPCQNYLPPFTYHNNLQSTVASYSQNYYESSPEPNNEEIYDEDKKEDIVENTGTDWSSVLECISQSSN